MKKGSSILLLVIGCLFIHHFIYDGGDTVHLALTDALYGFLLVVSFIIVLIFVLAKAFINLVEKKEKFNYLPFITVTLLIAVGWTIDYMQGTPSFNSAVILKASHPDNSGTGFGIELKENKQFVIHINHCEDHLQYIGSYIINKDTLHLKRDLCKQTDSVLYNNYLISKNWLYPIKNGKADTNDKRLEIETAKQ